MAAAEHKRNQAIRILKDPNRKQETKNYHVRQLLQDFEFFRDLVPTVRDRLPGMVALSVQRCGDVLFKEGDPPWRCYIVLSGSVSVWKLSAAVQEEDEPPPPEEDSPRVANGKSKDGEAVVVSPSEASTRCPSANSIRRQLSNRRASVGSCLGEDGDAPTVRQLSRRASTASCADDSSEGRRASRRASASRSGNGIGSSLSLPASFLKRTSMTRTSLMSLAASIDPNDDEDLGSDLDDEAVEKQKAANDQPRSVGRRFFDVVQQARRAKTGAPPSLWGKLSCAKIIGLKDDLAFNKPPANLYGGKVAMLGAGVIFGELALMQDQPRSATIICEERCEFLVIERDDFDKVLKSEMTRLREEKIDCLRMHVPGFTRLPSHKLDKAFYRFRKETFNKGHVFLQQGLGSKKGVFILLSGEIALKTTLDGKAEREVSTLVKGSFFGCTGDVAEEAFTAVAKTSCEVLSIGPRGLKHLPISLSVSMRAYLANVALTRIERLQQDARDEAARKARAGGQGRRRDRSGTPGAPKSAAPMPSTPNSITRAGQRAVQRRAFQVPTPTASPLRTSDVSKGFLKVEDLVAEEKQRRSVAVARSLPCTPLHRRGLRQDASAAPACFVQSAPKTHRRPSTAGSVTAPARLGRCSTAPGMICRPVLALGGS